MKPPELAEAEMIVSICDRWHIPPSVLLQEPVSSIRYLAIANLGRPEPDIE